MSPPTNQKKDGKKTYQSKNAKEILYAANKLTNLFFFFFLILLSITNVGMEI